MRVLMVNKFLHPNGGSETYVFKLGAYLASQGHQVEYFGMEHPQRQVGNCANAYTSNMDFHGTRLLDMLTYPIKTIYSIEARRKIGFVLDHFKPDVVHLNNVNFQLTPSILYEVKKRRLPVVQTVHDCQVACPNHRMYIEHRGTVCSMCLDRGGYLNCLKNRCIDSSRAKSFVAMLESYYYHMRNTYNLMDAYICPSKYMASVIQTGGVESARIRVLCNPTDFTPVAISEVKDRYVLYFGRLSKEKGIQTLLQVAEQTPDIQYVFAGIGPLEGMMRSCGNVRYVGLKSGIELQLLIAGAICTVYPSEWYENCPLSVIESQAMGTPVIGSNFGGIPELIDDGETGFLFRAGDIGELTRRIAAVWNDTKLQKQMREACLNKKQETMESYTKDLMAIYHKIGVAKSDRTCFAHHQQDQTPGI